LPLRIPDGQLATAGAEEDSVVVVLVADTLVAEVLEAAVTSVAEEPAPAAADSILAAHITPAPARTLLIHPAVTGRETCILLLIGPMSLPGQTAR
jgi:hypothetical protein